MRLSVEASKRRTKDEKRGKRWMIQARERGTAKSDSEEERKVRSEQK